MRGDVGGVTARRANQPRDRDAATLPTPSSAQHYSISLANRHLALLRLGANPWVANEHGHPVVPALIMARKEVHLRAQGTILKQHPNYAAVCAKPLLKIADMLNRIDQRPSAATYAIAASLLNSSKCDPLDIYIADFHRGAAHQGLEKLSDAPRARCVESSTCGFSRTWSLTQGEQLLGPADNRSAASMASRRSIRRWLRDARDRQESSTYRSRVAPPAWSAISTRATNSRPFATSRAPDCIQGSSDFVRGLLCTGSQRCQLYAGGSREPVGDDATQQQAGDSEQTSARTDFTQPR